ncbi:uncharacterized protein HKW66_Vig0207850 [Vigna angularis]|uniref:Uncharacterized protein n=1 Tax=Phaseolus angularis TaxID=3914 RepID=A0A8T0JGN4_PHAAN|nr:uncharacterized protein HKW66_Vig0207850 [Vigna angularis]
MFTKELQEEKIKQGKMNMTLVTSVIVVAFSIKALLGEAGAAPEQIVDTSGKLIYYSLLTNIDDIRNSSALKFQGFKDYSANRRIYIPHHGNEMQNLIVKHKTYLLDDLWITCLDGKNSRPRQPTKPYHRPSTLVPQPTPYTYSVNDPTIACKTQYTNKVSTDTHYWDNDTLTSAAQQRRFAQRTH